MTEDNRDHLFAHIAAKTSDTDADADMLHDLNINLTLSLDLIFSISRVESEHVLGPLGVLC